MNKNSIHVVAAVIENQQNQVFIAKRPDHVHQGALWEFPGGKVEEGESTEQALKRELFEELGIHIRTFEPLIQISHDYSDKSVFLDVWRVTKFDGDAHGKEGQPTRWINKNEFAQFDFPAANKAIITAATLPQYYLITPDSDFAHRTTFLETIEKRLQDGIRLLQLRAKNLNPQDLATLYQEVVKINQAYDALIMLNSSVLFAENLRAKGVHLSSKALMSATSIPKNMISGASCHSKAQMLKAESLGVDFILISPVLKTATHPNSKPIGWETFETFCKSSTIPVYALGGMQRNHLSKAINSGAQGIAGIRSLWCKPE